MRFFIAAIVFEIGTTHRSNTENSKREIGSSSFDRSSPELPHSSIIRQDDVQYRKVHNHRQSTRFRICSRKSDFPSFWILGIRCFQICLELPIPSFFINLFRLFRIQATLPFNSQVILSICFS